MSRCGVHVFLFTIGVKTALIFEFVCQLKVTNVSLRLNDIFLQAWVDSYAKYMKIVDALHYYAKFPVLSIESFLKSISAKGGVQLLDNS